LSDHLEDRANELVAKGLSPEDATAEAVRAFGNAEEIASELSLIHNQGAWRDAALSALPHLIAAALFAFHHWLDPLWLAGAFALIAAMTAIGWRRGRPLWMYSWLGYALFPFLLAGTLSVATVGHAVWTILTEGYSPTNPVSWALGIGLGVLGITLISYLLIWVSQRDWTHAALLVLPIPFLAVSLLAFDRGTYTRLEEADTQTAVLFAFVAFAVAIVVRLGDRLLKIGIIAASLPIGFLLSSNALEADLRFLMAALLSLPALLLVLAPLVLSLGAATHDDMLSTQRKREETE
jgi:hypothetical protein